jgi:hypothetical protein
VGSIEKGERKFIWNEKQLLPIGVPSVAVSSATFSRLQVRLIGILPFFHPGLSLEKTRCKIGPAAFYQECLH